MFNSSASSRILQLKEYTFAEFDNKDLGLNSCHYSFR